MTVIALARIFVQALNRDVRGGPSLSLLQGDDILDSPTFYLSLNLDALRLRGELLLQTTARTM